jgi:flagellar biosynthesis activator protein FlaF
MAQEYQGAGYGAAPQGGLPQYTEAWALIEAARRMAEATTAENAKESMRETLRLNWRLWTIFQAELSGEESTVPDEVRVNMLTLCKFIDQHTVDAIRKPTAEKIETLVNINRNIAGGLLDGLKKAVEETEREQGAHPATPDPAAPAAPLMGIDETI